MILNKVQLRESTHMNDLLREIGRCCFPHYMKVIHRVAFLPQTVIELRTLLSRILFWLWILRTKGGSKNIRHPAQQRKIFLHIHRFIFIRKNVKSGMTNDVFPNKLFSRI